MDKVHLAISTRAISLLLGEGVPILDAFDAVIKGGFEGEVSAGLARCRKELADGGTISEGLAAAGFPPLVVRGARAGEETGKLDQTLGIVAEELEWQVKEKPGGDLGGQILLALHVLATSLELETGLLDGIGITAESVEDSAVKKALLAVRDDVATGSSFGDALAKQEVFNGPVLLCYLRAGDCGGRLDVVLGRAAVFLADARRMVGTD